jgi:hypothetical protein
MRRFAKAYVKLAEIFENHGVHEAADIIDSQILRIANTIQDERYDTYKQLLDDGFRKKFKVKSGSDSFVSHLDKESFWVYPDGQVMFLNGTHHSSAIDNVASNIKTPNGTRLIDDSYFDSLSDIYNNSTYRMFGKMFGAIRVHVDYGDMDITSYVVPTEQQLNSIRKIQKDYNVKSSRIEQYGHIVDELDTFRDLESWQDALKKYEQVAAATQNNVPQSTDYQSTVKSIDKYNPNEPISKALDRRSLYTNYPGPENAKLRELYEKSAQRVAQLGYDNFHDDMDDPSDSLNEPSDVYALAESVGVAQTALKQAWDTEHPPANLNQIVSNSKRPQSFWIWPDGSRAELGSSRHKIAFESVLGKHKIHLQKGFSDLVKPYNGDLYEMMGGEYGAIRIFVNPDTNMIVDSYSMPTEAQIEAVRKLKESLDVASVYITQKLGYKLRKIQPLSIDDWQSTMKSIAEQIKKKSVPKQEAKETEYTKVKNFKPEEFDAPIWKVKDRQRLREEYPGSKYDKLRSLYEKSAQRIAQQLNLDFDNNTQANTVQDNSQQSDEDLIEDSRTQLLNAWNKKFPPVKLDSIVGFKEHPEYRTPEQTDPSQSFWVWPDGSRTELGTAWHSRAQYAIMRINNFDSHTGVQELKKRHNYDVYKLMGREYGAIRVLITEGKMFVEAYSSPTEQQFASIQRILEGLPVSKYNIYQNDKKFDSIEAWKAESIRQEPIVSKETEYTKIQNQDSDEFGIPLWKTQDRRRLREEYPGPEYNKLRSLYEKSAQRIAQQITNDERYKNAIEEGHLKKFKLITPDSTINKFRDMHSFWLYPDGRIIDLGKRTHDEAFDMVMHESRLDEEEEFGTMYSSKDGAQHIMGDYFGMIRVFVFENIVYVSSYSIPTQSQIQKIQEIISNSQAELGQIEQFGYVQGGKLLTSSISNWLSHLSKFTQNATAESGYNNMSKQVDEVNETAEVQPYSKTMDKRSLETNYPGDDNEKLRKLYERSAGTRNKV